MLKNKKAATIESPFKDFVSLQLDWRSLNLSLLALRHRLSPILLNIHTTQYITMIRFCQEYLPF